MNAATRSRPLWLVLSGGFLLLLLFVVAVRLLMGLAPAPDEDAARAAERAKVHQELEAENAQKLQNYAWVDKAKGAVQIPIARAMELAIMELNSKKPTAAGPIATPAPSPAASPATSPPGQPATAPNASPAPSPLASPTAAPTASPAPAPSPAPAASPAAEPTASPATAPGSPAAPSSASNSGIQVTVDL